MGWKSTIEINRDEAKRLITKKLLPLDHLSNKELENMIERMGYGEGIELEYYGYNFIVVDNDTTKKE